MTWPPGGPERVLVIKLGALGDFVQALGAMKAIRAHHLGATLVLLTTAPFEEMGRGSGLFDEVWIDPRARPLALGPWLGLRRRLRGAGFGRIYDLQCSRRTNLYFRFFLGGAAGPEWCGVAEGCSHRHSNPDRHRLHTLERLADQLAVAGIGFLPPPDVSWMSADLGRFPVDRRFALLVPGGAAHRPEKRWPAESYARLATRLTRERILPLLIGGDGERELNAAIAAATPEALDLSGRTSFAEIVELARRAEVAVGNDTGPMHLAAAAACPCVVLFSAASEPALCAPRGLAVTVLKKPRLGDLAIDEVARAAGLEGD
jgi:ADP-heptose:LPS heptosyltransferase